MSRRRTRSSYRNQSQLREENAEPLPPISPTSPTSPISPTRAESPPLTQSLRIRPVGPLTINTGRDISPQLAIQPTLTPPHDRETPTTQTQIQQPNRNPHEVHFTPRSQSRAKNIRSQLQNPFPVCPVFPVQIVDDNHLSGIDSNETKPDESTSPNSEQLMITPVYQPAGENKKGDLGVRSKPLPVAPTIKATNNIHNDNNNHHYQSNNSSDITHSTIGSFMFDPFDMDESIGMDWGIPDRKNSTKQPPPPRQQQQTQNEDPVMITPVYMPGNRGFDAETVTQTDLITPVGNVKPDFQKNNNPKNDQARSRKSTPNPTNDHDVSFHSFDNVTFPVAPTTTTTTTTKPTKPTQSTHNSTTRTNQAPTSAANTSELFNESKFMAGDDDDDDFFDDSFTQNIPQKSTQNSQSFRSNVNMNPTSIEIPSITPVHRPVQQNNPPQQPPPTQIIEPIRSNHSFPTRYQQQPQQQPKDEPIPPTPISYAPNDTLAVTGGSSFKKNFGQSNPINTATSMAQKREHNRSNINVNNTMNDISFNLSILSHFDNLSAHNMTKPSQKNQSLEQQPQQRPNNPVKVANHNNSNINSTLGSLLDLSFGSAADSTHLNQSRRKQLPPRQQSNGGVQLQALNFLSNGKQILNGGNTRKNNPQEGLNDMDMGLWDGKDLNQDDDGDFSKSTIQKVLNMADSQSRKVSNDSKLSSIFGANLSAVKNNTKNDPKNTPKRPSNDNNDTFNNLSFINFNQNSDDDGDDDDNNDNNDGDEDYSEQDEEKHNQYSSNDKPNKTFNQTQNSDNFIPNRKILSKIDKDLSPLNDPKHFNNTFLTHQQPVPNPIQNPPNHTNPLNLTSLSAFSAIPADIHAQFMSPSHHSHPAQTSSKPKCSHQMPPTPQIESSATFTIVPTKPPAIGLIAVSPDIIHEYESQLRTLYPFRTDANLNFLAELQLAAYLSSDRLLTSTSIFTGTLLTQMKPQIGPFLPSAITRALYQQHQQQLQQRLLDLQDEYRQLYTRFSHMNPQNLQNLLKNHPILRQIKSTITEIKTLPLKFSPQHNITPYISSDSHYSTTTPSYPSGEIAGLGSNTLHWLELVQRISPNVTRPKLNEVEQLIFDMARDKQYRRALWFLDNHYGLGDSLAQNKNNKKELFELIQNNAQNMQNYNDVNNNPFNPASNPTLAQLHQYKPQIVYICTCTDHLTHSTANHLENTSPHDLKNIYYKQYYNTDPLEDPLYSTNNDIDLSLGIELDPILESNLGPKFVKKSPRFRIITCFIQYMYIWLNYIIKIEDKQLAALPQQANRQGGNGSLFMSSTGLFSLKSNNYLSNQQNNGEIGSPTGPIASIEDLQQLSATKQLDNQELVELCSLFTQHGPIIPISSLLHKTPPGTFPTQISIAVDDGNNDEDFNNLHVSQNYKKRQKINPLSTKKDQNNGSSRFQSTGPPINPENFCPFVLYLHALLLSQMSTANLPEASLVNRSGGVKRTRDNKKIVKINNTNNPASLSTQFIPTITTATPYLIQHLLLLSIQRLPTLHASWLLLEETITSTEQLTTLTLPYHPLTRLFITKMLTKLPAPNKETLTRALFSLSTTLPSTSTYAAIGFLVSKVIYDRSLPLHYVTTTVENVVTEITTTTTTTTTTTNTTTPVGPPGNLYSDQHMNNDTPTVLTNTRTRVNHHLQDDPRLRYHDFLEFDPFNTDVLTPYVEFLVETENIRDFTTLVQSLLSPSISNTNSSNLFTVTPTANKTSLGGLTVTNSTTTAQIFIILADYFSLLQDFPKSIQCLQQALILTTTAFSLSQIWLKLGLIYFQSFQKNSALVSLYTALRYNPDNLPAQYYISYVYKRNKQYLLSIMWLEKCISKNKKNIIYWLDLGDNFYSLAGGNIGSMGISNGITVASSITNGGLDKALRLYKCAISIASETNNFQYLFPLCFKIGSLLKAHSLNAEAADYFSIILDYIIPTQTDGGNENDSNMDTNNKANKKQAQNNCYFDHPYRSILEPQQVLFLAEVRCNQGRFDIAKRYLLMLIRQYELSSNQANNNAGLSNLNAGGESIAQAKAMLKRCEAAGVFE